MGRLTRDEEIRRFFAEMEFAPAGKEISVTAATVSYDEEFAATGKVSMAQITAFGVVSRKTVKKHMDAGELIGRKVKVRGIDTWLFEPEHAKAYLERVVGLLCRAEEDRVSNARVSASRPATAPDGYVTITDLAKRGGFSRWFVYDAIADGRLFAEDGGYKGAKLIPEREAARFVREEAEKARPYRQGERARSTRPRPGPSERRRLVINDRLVLVLILLDQEGENPSALARDLGVGPQTVRNWSTGVSFPDDLNVGRLVAYARGRYALTVGPELAAIAERYHRDHHASYQRRRTAERREKAGLAD